jgi:hypothetical protein
VNGFYFLQPAPNPVVISWASALHILQLGTTKLFINFGKLDSDATSTHQCKTSDHLQEVCLIALPNPSTRTIFGIRRRESLSKQRRPRGYSSYSPNSSFLENYCFIRTQPSQTIFVPMKIKSASSFPLLDNSGCIDWSCHCSHPNLNCTGWDHRIP